MKEIVLIACLVFGAMMVVTSAHAQEIEAVYCKFDVKKWEGSLLKFLQKGSDCKVEVKTKYGSFDYDQPLVPDLGVWDRLTKGSDHLGNGG